MARYSNELKQQIMLRMMPPNNETVGQIARDSGLSESTLYKWQKEARDKYAIVVEISTLSEIELSEYCRSKGLFVEQVEAWRDACMQANGGVAEQATRLEKELRNKERENKILARELKRKDAALAETAALLVLRKKAREIWGDPEEE